MNTIRALRQARGWTQFELALKVGVQPHAVYLWESGRRAPQVARMRKLGVLFGRCSDEIHLAPEQAFAATPHRPHADRRQGEPVPGRHAEGHVIARGHGAPAAGDARITRGVTPPHALAITGAVGKWGHA